MVTSATEAHYGSVATELAICRRFAGLADRPELGRLELTGRAPWIEHALGHATGAAVPATGAAVRVADAWCCRMAADRVAVVAPAAALGRWQRAAHQAVVAGHRLACRDRSGETSALSLVGPLADAVLRVAGLPHDPCLGRLATAAAPWGTVTVLREAGDAFLLLVEDHAPEDAWRALMEAGRPFGLSPVGADALRLRAAARPG